MITKELFGYMPCGCKVYSYTLANDSITSVSILNYGGIIKNLWVKDKNGEVADVVCGYDDIDSYLTANAVIFPVGIINFLFRCCIILIPRSRRSDHRRQCR